MRAPRISLVLDENDGPFLPGDQLTGHFCVEAPHDQAVRAIELSVLWSSIGQGDEDLAVHYFDRIPFENGRRFERSAERTFATQLPSSPLTYDGVLIKIRWWVRLRIFLLQGKEIVEQRPFALGSVPSAKVYLNRDEG